MTAETLNNIAEEYATQGRYAEAEATTTKALAVAQNVDTEQLGRAWNNLGNIAKERKEYQQALEHYAKAIVSYKKTESKQDIAMVLSNIGNIYDKILAYTQALEHYNEALVLFEEIDAKSKMITNLGSIGNIYDKLSDYTQALDCYYKSLSIAEEIGAKKTIVFNLGNIGNIYTNLSDYPKALEYYRNALVISEELGMKNNIAVNLGNIGRVYGSLSDYRKALEYFYRSLIISEELGASYSIASKLTNIGLVYSNLSDYPKALEYLNKALAIAEELGEKESIARNLGNIGFVYSHLLDYPKALEYLHRALAISEELGEKNFIAINLGNLGNVYMEMEDYPNAIEYLQKAFAISEEIGAQSSKLHWLLSIGKLYATPSFNGYHVPTAVEYLNRVISNGIELGIKQIVRNAFKCLFDLYYNSENWREAIEAKIKHEKIEKEINLEEAKKQAEQLDYERRTAEREKQIAVERARAEEHKRILDNILPQVVTERLIRGEKLIADHYENVSVLFADIVGFTKISQRISPEELVESLDEIFSAFDELADRYELEKIKTIGDSYMVVSGVPVARADHAEVMVRMALDMQEVIKGMRLVSGGNRVEIRIGIHSGGVVAGIIGKKKFAYDLWGDAVNTASRMESHGEGGKIHVSEEFKEKLAGSDICDILLFVERGDIEIKGKGIMRTYFLSTTPN